MASYHYEDQESSAVRIVMTKVFAWLATAVALSGVSAYIAAGIPAFQSGPVTLLLFILQLGMVILLASSINTLSYAMTQAVFLLYAVTTGITCSVIFLVYDIHSIAQIFFYAAGMFAIMAIYGFYTRTDLTHYRSLFMMALWGLILSLIINIFLQSSRFDTILAGVGVLIFAALTAFDIQIIKNLAHVLLEDDESLDKVAIVCALQLYLDFINLFLNMLRLWGRGKQ